MAKKVVALFIFYSFAFNVLVPIDMAGLAIDADRTAVEDKSNHYCEIYKGSCKHGDSCPNKHLHKPMKMETSHSSHKSSNHSSDHKKVIKKSSDKSQDKGVLVIGASCHSSDKNNNSKMFTKRFLVTLTEEFYSIFNYTYLIPSKGLSYSSYIKDTPHRPPAV